MPIARESAVFPVDEYGKVASAMHLHKTKRGPEDDLDVAHEQLVAAVEAGTITLADREAAQEEIEEAWGKMILLDKLTDNRAMDDETNNA
jgi:hypothetical protein